MTDLADFWKRMEWSDDDAERLHAEGLRFFETDPYDFRVDLDGDGGQVVVERRAEPAAEAEILKRVERLLGTYLDHVRAALNCLTYQIALSDVRESPELVADVVEFPIFNDPKTFRKYNRVKKLSHENRRRFESVQPYDANFNGLWILHELARVHRHRLLHTLGMGTVHENTGLTIDGGTLTEFEVLHDGVLEDETPILSFAFARERPYVEVNAKVAFTICIDHPLCRGRDGSDVINEITRDAAHATAELVGKAGMPHP
jgi:hypothetical protein